MQRRFFLRSAGALALLPVLPDASFAALPGARQQPGTLAVYAGAIGPGMYAAGDFARARFHDPRGMAVDAHGNVFVADYVNSVVRRLTPQGEVGIVAGQVEQRDAADGPALQARFYSPECVAVGPDGVLYVSDSGSETVRRIGRDGTVSTLAGAIGVEGYADGPGTSARFNHPVGLGVDRQGNVFVADAYNSTVRRIAPGGEVTTLAGTAGATGWRDGVGARARFNTPVGLALDATGNVYVSEYFNHTIRRITPDGRVSTVAGIPGKAGFGDGPAKQALFRHPQSLAFAPDGSLIVADTGNSRVRRIVLGGDVRTLAGGADGETVVPGPLPAELRAPYGVAALADGSVLVTGMNAILRIVLPEPLKA